MDADASGCFICSKHLQGGDVPGGVLHDDGIVYAGHTHPLGSDDVALGYLMVEPRRHVTRLGDLTDEEAAAVGVVANRLCRAGTSRAQSTCTASCSVTGFLTSTCTSHRASRVP